MRKWITLLEAEGETYHATLLHGTPEQFDEFDFDKITSRGPYGDGVYLSNDRALAKEYSDGGKPMKVEVTLKKPYWLDLDLDYSETMALRKPFRSQSGKQSLIDQGYDGVVVKQGRYIEVCAYRGAELKILK